MLYSLAIHTPGNAQTLMTIVYALAILVCLLVIAFSIMFKKILDRRHEKEDNKKNKLRSIAPIFMLAALPIGSLAAIALLLVEVVILEFAIVWAAVELKKPCKAEPKSAPKPAPKPEPEPEPEPEPQPEPQPEVVFIEHEATEEEEAMVAELVREDISIEEAHDALSDEVAKHFVDIEKIETGKEKKYEKKNIINIDTLSDNFSNGDVVTIDAMIQKGLLPKGTDHVKVLARGHLNKHITVEANEYSSDAIKMIILTGGKVIRIK